MSDPELQPHTIMTDFELATLNGAETEFQRVGVFSILDKVFIGTFAIWEIIFYMMKMLHFNIKLRNTCFGFPCRYDNIGI